MFISKILTLRGASMEKQNHTHVELRRFLGVFSRYHIANACINKLRITHLQDSGQKYENTFGYRKWSIKCHGIYSSSDSKSYGAYFKERQVYLVLSEVGNAGQAKF